MAMFAMLRRASSTVLPLASRRAVTSSSSRTFHSFLSVRTLENVDLLHREITTVVPSLRIANNFATKTFADDYLIQLLEHKIMFTYNDDTAKRLNTVIFLPRLKKVKIPDDFPFEVEDNRGERTIQLKRQYQNETIKVQVHIPNVAPEENDDEDDGEKKNNSEPIFFNFDDKKDSESSIPLVVSVFKGNGVYLEFGVTAFSDEISIDSLSLKHHEESEDQLAYEGPEFSDLDENLQKAFLKYLEIRGIKPSTTNFLQEYMFIKDKKEYVAWLKNMKIFIEK